MAHALDICQDGHVERESTRRLTHEAREQHGILSSHVQPWHSWWLSDSELPQKLAGIGLLKNGWLVALSWRVWQNWITTLQKGSSTLVHWCGALYITYLAHNNTKTCFATSKQKLKKAELVRSGQPAQLGCYKSGELSALQGRIVWQYLKVEA